MIKFRKILGWKKWFEYWESKIWFLTQRRNFWFDLAQIWCFLDDLDLIWWLNRIIFVTFCQSSETNLNQRSKRNLFVNLDYRVNSFVLSVNWRRRTSLLCFVFVYIHNELIVVCFDVFFEWSSDTSLLCFIITKLYWNEMFCLFNARVF